MGDVEEIGVEDFRVGDTILTPSTRRPAYTITAIEPAAWDGASVHVTIHRVDGTVRRLLFSPPTRYLRQV